MPVIQAWGEAGTIRVVPRSGHARSASCTDRCWRKRDDLNGYSVRRQRDQVRAESIEKLNDHAPKRLPATPCADR